MNFVVSHSGRDRKLSSIPMYYSDSFFKGSACSYDHRLALMSLGLAMSSFSAKQSGDRYIRGLLRQIGCDNSTVMSRKFDDTLSCEDSCAFCFAAKKLPDGTYLVPVAIRSIGYGGEWVSNAHAVSASFSDHAAGFKAAADGVYDALAGYLASKELGRDCVKLWITGFSRGAAIANLLGARLTEESGIVKDRIFVYTFATPRTVYDRAWKYSGNIFNIVSDMDIVPRLPFDTWGFTRYGTDLYLPCAALRGKEEYLRLLEGMRAHFDTLMRDTGGDFAYEPLDAQEIALDLFTDCLDDLLKSPEKYENDGYQAILMDYMRSKTGGTDFAPKAFLSFLLDGNDELAGDIFRLMEGWAHFSALERVQHIGRLPTKLKMADTPAREIISMGLSILFRYAAKLTATKVTGGEQDYYYEQLVTLLVDVIDSGGRSKLLMQHWPETYLSWLRAGDEKTLYRTNSYLRRSVK